MKSIAVAGTQLSANDVSATRVQAHRSTDQVLFITLDRKPLVDLHNPPACRTLLYPAPRKQLLHNFSQLARLTCGTIEQDPRLGKKDCEVRGAYVPKCHLEVA